MSERLRVLERNAATERALLAAEIAQLRLRTRPASIAADLKDTAKLAVAPLASKIANAVRRHPLPISLVAAIAGAASSFPKAAHPKGGTSTALHYSRYDAASGNAPMPKGVTAGLVGLGILAGVVAGRGIKIGDEERRVVGAIAADIHRAFVNASIMHVNGILDGHTKYANAMKVALAGIAVLTQRK